MARAGLALGGGLLGGHFGGPIGRSIGFTIGNLIGGALFGDQVEGQTIEGPRLNDLLVATSTYGKGIPLTYGSVPVAGNMIWATDIVEIRREEQVESGGGGGGKGGGPSIPDTTRGVYEYFGNFAFAFAGNEVALVRRIWAGSKLLVDLSDVNAGNRHFKYGQDHYRIYLGTETQLPDPLIEADKGVGKVPGHRGMVYVVFENLPLKDFSNGIPNIKAELVAVAPTANLQESFNIGLDGDGHGGDSTRLDFNEPFAVDIHGGGATTGALVTRFNRIDGTEVLRFETGLDQNFLDELTNQSRSQNIATTGSPEDHGPLIDHTNSDIYVPAEGTTGQGGGFALYDKNGTFILYRHIGTFGAPRRGHVLLMNNTRYIIINKGITSGENQDLAVLRWIIDPLNPTSERGVIVPGFVSEAKDTGIQWVDFAYDPTNAELLGGGRVWAVGNDSGDDPNIVLINSAGGIGAITDLTSSSTVPSGAKVIGVTYDLNTDALFLVCDTTIFKLDPDTFAVLDEIGTSGNPASDAGTVEYNEGTTEMLMVNQLTVQGLFHIVTNEGAGDVGFVRISTQDLTILNRFVDTTVFPASPGPLGEFQEGPVWDPTLFALWGTDGGYRRYFLDRFGRGTVQLSTIVSDLCVRSGLATTDIDVVALTDEVRGFLIERPTTARNAMEPLQQAFFFDGAEIDFKILFKKRDGAPSLTIPGDEIVAAINGAEEANIEVAEIRRQEVEVPRRVIASYMHPDNDYQVATQMEQRIAEIPDENLKGITRSKNELNMRFPIVFSDQEAREVCAKSLGSASIERTTLSLTIPPKFIRLDPTDVITVTKVSVAFSADLDIRIVKMEIGDGGVMEVLGMLQQAAIFSPNVVATASPLNPAPPIPFPVATQEFLMNLPALRGALDEDGAANFAAAPSFFTPNPDWTGALLFKSTEIDGAFVGVGSVTTQINWGLAKTVLGTTSRFTVFDDVNTITLEFQTDEAPTSVSDVTLFDGVNFLFIPSTGELLQFGTVTQVTGRRYILSHLLRGRLGTEVFITANAINAQCIVINLSRLSKFSSSAERGLARFFRVVTLGGDVQDSATKTFTNISASLISLSVADITGSRDGSNNLTINWHRRTRFDGDWLDLVDVALNEASENYEVDILDQPNPGATVLRTIVVTAETASYTAAEQSTDGLTPGDPVDMEIFQISAITGRGRVRAATV